MTNLAYKNEIQVYNYVNEYYESWLSTLSKNTAKNYKSDIELFSNVVFEKEITYLTIDELESLKTLHANKFFKHMKDASASNSTMKRRFNAVRSFLKELKKNFPSINVEAMNKKLESDDLDRKSWGNLNWNETQLCWNYAEEQNIEGKQMSMLIKLASITSIRLEALLTLTWEDHFFVTNEYNKDINYIDVVDKKKRHKKSISEEFYSELREKLNHKGRLFPSLHAQKARNYLKDIFNALNFDERRNLSFHSLKKTGVNRVIVKYGDLLKAKEQGNHSSFNTTDKYYLEISENLSDMASYTLDQEVDLKAEISHLDKDQLVDAINMLSDSAKFELLRILEG